MQQTIKQTNKVPQNPVSDTHLKAQNTSITVPLPSKTTQNHSFLSTPTVTVSNAPGDCISSAVSFGGAPKSAAYIASSAPGHRLVLWVSTKGFLQKKQKGLRFWEIQV